MPIFIGCVLSYILHKRALKQPKEVRKRQNAAGLLLASGLITGEALMGVLVAIAAVTFQGQVPYMQNFTWAGWLSVIVFVGVISYTYRRVKNS